MTFNFTSKKFHHTGAQAPPKNGASAMRETPTETGGAIKGLKTWLAVSVTLVALLGVLGSSASAAHAESPWWHLTSGSRPTYLTHVEGSKAGVPGTPAEPEVQELSIKLEPYGPDPEQAWLVLGAGSTSVGEFVTKGIAEIEEYPESYLLTAAHLQTALEGPYGKGVQVSEETKGGVLSFRVTSAPGVEPLSVVAPIVGVPTVEVISPGKPEGAGIPAVPDGELNVTAENVGDAAADGSTKGHAITLTDVIPANLEAISVAGTIPFKEGDFQAREKIPCAIATSGGRQVATCTLVGSLAPYDQIEMRVGVRLKPGAATGEENSVSISGGEGFVCKEVAAETGSFKNSACVEAPTSPNPSNFERTYTGSVAPASLERPITVSEAPVPFGVEDYEMALEEAGGASTTQAGAHPFQLNTTFDLNQLKDTNPIEQPAGSFYRPEVTPPALAKDLNFELPAGLIGNATAIPQCTITQFFEIQVTAPGVGKTEDDNACPADSAVGVATVTVHEPATVGTVSLTEPIFNLEPREGEPARFGFYVVIANSPVLIDTSVRTGSDYGVTVSVNNITQTAAFLSSEVTFWGVPGDPRHDNQRGWGCLYEARNFTPHLPCIPSEETHPKPFLSLPTSCATANATSVTGDSWSAPGNFFEFTGAFEPGEALGGCNRLQFAPEIKVAPDGQEASKPTGLTVDVHVPQEVNNNAAGAASANVKNITVAFPEGVVLNPAAADGLVACPQAQTGFAGFKELDPGGEPGNQTAQFSPEEASCPDASKVGSVEIVSPLLPAGQVVAGSLYLATPAPNGELGNNPFNTLVSMYIIAKDPISGVLVKLPGSVSLNPVTGQITATFDNNPQLAFEDARIHLFGGERAPLATPAHCGTYTTNATFTPWSGTGAVSSSSSFNVTSGPGGGPCPPAALPFSPTLAAGTTSNSAGSFSPLSTTISREDGQQNIDKVQLHMPPGLSGILKGVPLCAEAQANAGTCSAASEIGKTVVSVGLGGDPFSVTGGEVFLTEKIAGSPGDDPFGLSIVNPAVAGPFNLGKVIVRATIEVDPHTAQLTVTTTEIPHILQGIPLQIKHVNVTIDRPGFTFNSTNCSAQQITGTIGAVEGASAPVAVPFQVTNCAALKFAPKFSVSTKGKNSKAGGATLVAKLSYPTAAQGTQANITRVKVDLPKQLPSRLTTLQKACTSAQFEANPANCPKESKIGFAKVTTPLLPVPLEGPAIFVSHGNEAFPSLTMVLQGYGITVDLVGTTFISSKGITSTTFKTVPDVPFNTFTLTLPQEKFSALAANVPAKAHYSLCGQTLAMPTEFLAQNGAKINESTKISVTGCAKKKTTKKKKAKKQAKSHKGGK
jgi:hypothetical protein